MPDKKPVDLVTGASCALGAELSRRLVAKGRTVRALLHLNPKSAEAWKGIPAGVIPYVADLTLPAGKDRQALLEACRGVGSVFHVAAAVYNYKNPVDTLMRTNVEGTENLLSALATANPRRQVRFIFASTVSVYGYGRKELLTEDSEVRPKTPYAKSKYIAEQVVQSYSLANKNMEYTTMRLGTIYGEGYERPSFCRVFRLIRKGEMRYIGNGENHLTLINVHDAVDAFLLAATRNEARNKVYNLTDGVPHTQRRLFSIAAKHMGADPIKSSVHPILARIARHAKRINMDEFDFLISNRVVDITKIKRDLGFSPRARMEKEGVAMIDRCHE